MRRGCWPGGKGGFLTCKRHKLSDAHHQNHERPIMKRTFLILSVALTSLTILYSSTGKAAPLGTAFIYNGRLTDSGLPANGNYDMRCILRDAASAGNQVGPILTNKPVAVSNGLFTMSLDFGGVVFDGNARWLEIGVRTNGSAATYTILNPLQPVTPTPYALFSSNAAVAATAVSVASGQVVKSLNGLADNVTLSAGANVTLTPSGNTLQISASTSGGSGGFQNFQVFDTNNGTFTVPAGVTRIMVEVWGGGGSGGIVVGSGGGGGGGAGGYGKQLFNVTPGTSYPVVVGRGDNLSGPPYVGGSSSFGDLISASGGHGSFVGQGNSSDGYPGGAGGTSTASFNVAGATGNASGSRRVYVTSGSGAMRKL